VKKTARAKGRAKRSTRADIPEAPKFRDEPPDTSHVP
jgi:hypothetical protein